MLPKVIVAVVQIAAGIVVGEAASKTLDKAVVGVKKFVDKKKEGSHN